MYKNKKAFTLAEILVVLTVIGVIASITIPQLTGGVDDAHYKAGFKKAYSTVANIAAIEKANGNLPQTVSKDGLISFFNALNNNLAVDGYAEHNEAWREVVAKGAIRAGIVWQGQSFGDENDSFTSTNSDPDHYSPWIVTSDNMAFFVQVDGLETCEKKSKINSSSVNLTNAIKKSCVLVMVDVNGLHRLPNRIEPQLTVDELTSTKKLQKLTRDRFYIFIGSDGAAKGSELLTATGRILSGQK